MTIEHLKDYIGSERHVENVNRSRKMALQSIQDKKQKRIEKYFLHPKQCKQCKKPLEYEKQKNTFCSNSCATSYNNARRGPMSDESKSKISESVYKRRGTTKHDSTHGNCIVCNVSFLKRRRTQKCCSEKCLKEFRRVLHDSEEYRNKLSSRNKQLYQEGKIKGWASRDRLKPSYPEQYFMDMFSRDEIEYEREVKIGRYFADFVFGKIILEVDGSQHDREPYKSSDIRKDQFLTEQGYTVIRIRWRNVKTNNGYQTIQDEYKKLKEIIKPSVG